MKNVLLAGTSALALTFAAAGAHAETAPGKFDIKISGDAYFEGGMVDASNDYQTPGASNDTLTGGDFTNRFRLQINPEAKADNGLTYGAVARLRANFGGSFGAPGAIDGDKAYVYVSGTFGEVRGGVTYGPSDVTYVGHPADFQMYGVYDQWRSYTGKSASYAFGQYGTGASTATGSVGTEGMQLLRSHNIDTKLVYYSPRFFGQTPTTGLQGAVSYTPHNGDANAAAGAGTVNNVSINTAASRNGYSGIVGAQQTTGFNDVVELTANYVENWGPWMTKLSAGYNTGSALDSSGAATASRYNDLESFQFGAQVGYQNFVVGGGYMNAGRSGYNRAAGTLAADQDAWNIGAQYTWGPIVGGIKFIEETDAGSTAIAGNRILDALTFGVMYTVAPGLRVGLEDTVFWAKSENGGSNFGGLTPSYTQNGNVFLARTAVTF
ncbi:MAG: porin [Rhodospirillaceae bacterium]